jgi:hypothetical protein
MYESGLPDADHESHFDLREREGILFIEYPRRRTGRRDHPPTFKVKSILKGTEYESQHVAQKTTASCHSFKATTRGTATTHGTATTSYRRIEANQYCDLWRSRHFRECIWTPTDGGHRSLL